jgi:uncharacterized repeat protein (TIGR03803 family)
MTSPRQGTKLVQGVCSGVERCSCQIRPQPDESRMSKIVQHLGRISRIRRWVITTALLSALMLVPVVVVAQTPSTHFEVLHAFHGSDGNYTLGGVTLDAAGNLYGATYLGGDLNCSFNSKGCGVVFELNTAGKEKVLHKFTGTDGLGAMAGGNLIRDSQGTLYGETEWGGDFSCSSEGCGTVFKLDKAGKETVLYAFTGSNGDGANPAGNLILDESGNLYGTTLYNGAGYGTVFKIDKSGKESVLYSFLGPGAGDGSLPIGLVEDAAGNLYGATNAGGITGGKCGKLAGCGIVYKLTKSGKETVLYRFTGPDHGDGQNPTSPLVFDQKGNLYGTTTIGGKGVSGSGTVFKVTKTGKETILHAFNGNDGYSPIGPVVFDDAGNLYGTTLDGGSLGYGTVFKLTKGGKETVLHNFSGGKDGMEPDWGVAIDGTGRLYGLTREGGDLKCAVGGGIGCGVVFRITQ